MHDMLLPHIGLRAPHLTVRQGRARRGHALATAGFVRSLLVSGAVMAGSLAADSEGARAQYDPATRMALPEDDDSSPARNDRARKRPASSEFTERLNRQRALPTAPVVNVRRAAAPGQGPAPTPPPVQADLQSVVIVVPVGAAPAPPPEDALGFGPEPAAGRAEAAGDALGFDGDNSASSARATLPAAPSAWSLQGAVRELTAMRTEQDVTSRLATLRMLLDLKLTYRDDVMLAGVASSLLVVTAARAEYDFAMLNHIANDTPTRQAYLQQAFPQDLYVALSWGALDVSFGKQIVVFGQGEALSTLDVVNPRDLREPVLTDPSDMRLAVLMSRLGLHLGSVHVEGLVVHEANAGLLAPPLSEFSPTRKLMLESASLASSLHGHELRYSHQPENALWRTSSMQYHGRLTYLGAGFELSLQAASVLDALGVSSLPTVYDLQRQDIDLHLFHPRYTLLGHAGAFTAGAFVVRWEFAVDLDRLASTRRIDTTVLRLDAARFTMVHGMAGISWVPDSSTNMSFEWLQGYVPKDPRRHPVYGEAPTALLWPVETPQVALRFGHTFWEERAQLNALMVLIGVYPFKAFAGKFDFSYKVYDSLQVTVGYIAYHGSTYFSPLYGFGKNDRVFFGLRWDFATH
jgi:hypothetical protein